MFKTFPKIPRLNRNIVITEKIDGTNGAIVIGLVDDPAVNHHTPPPLALTMIGGNAYGIWAQSRNRLVTEADDNYNFAAWVLANCDDLFLLGPGHHFGEWWGKGINRGYGVHHREFTLFNTARWAHCLPTQAVSVVPMLYTGPFDTEVVQAVLEDLNDSGSVVAPGFMRPEGIVVYHTHANVTFKVTIENDDKPKGINLWNPDGGIVYGETEEVKV